MCEVDLNSDEVIKFVLLHVLNDKGPFLCIDVYKALSLSIFSEKF